MSKKIVGIEKECYRLYKMGKSVKYIASFFNKGVSTIYAYIQKEYDNEKYPVIRAEIKRELICGNFKYYIESLNYRDLCVIRRKFCLYGSDKKSIINSILKYFKSYSILGLYPENLSRAIVKQAYYRKAKELHPDANKSKDGSEFKEMHQIYESIMREVVK